MGRGDALGLWAVGRSRSKKVENLWPSKKSHRNLGTVLEKESSAACPPICVNKTVQERTKRDWLSEKLSTEQKKCWKGEVGVSLVERPNDSLTFFMIRTQCTSWAFASFLPSQKVTEILSRSFQPYLSSPPPFCRHIPPRGGERGWVGRRLPCPGLNCAKREGDQRRKKG